MFSFQKRFPKSKQNQQEYKLKHEFLFLCTDVPLDRSLMPDDAKVEAPALPQHKFEDRKRQDPLSKAFEQ